MTRGLADGMALIRRVAVQLPLLPLLLCGTGVVTADGLPIASLNRSSAVSFEREILPILRKSCLACHSQKEKQGGLMLESVAAMLKGGDSGPAVVPGQAMDSRLLQLAAHSDEPLMPPAENEVNAQNLSPTELGLIQLWINQGAKSTGRATPLSPGSWQPVPDRLHPALAVSLSSDSRFVAAARADQICLYHVGSGQLVTQMIDQELQTAERPTGAAHRDLVQSLAFNADGDLLASGGFREIKLWRKPSDVQKRQIATGTDLRCLRLSPDTSMIATNGPEHSVQLFHREDGQPAQRLIGHTKEITSLRFSSDGRHLYTASLDQTVLIWNLATADLIGQIDTPAAVNDLELVLVSAPTGQLPHPGVQVLTAGADNVVRVWSFGDEPPGETQMLPAVLAAEIKGHSQPVTCLAAIPGRPKEFVSGSRDGTARWWRTDDGRQLRQFNQGGPATIVAVSPDAQRFVTGGENNSARLWNSNGQQMAELKGDIRRNTAAVRAKQQLNSANARVSVAKRQLDNAEKDVPKKEEAEKKLAEAAEKANQNVTEKQTALDEAKKMKLQAEQQAVAVAATVRELQATRTSIQQLAERAAEQLKTRQAQSARLQQAVNAAPQNEQLQTLLAAAQAEVQAAQQEVQQQNAGLQEPTQQLQQAIQKAVQAAQEVDRTQKPYNDSLAALEKAASDQNLVSQQLALAAVEAARSRDLVPVYRTTLEQAEAGQQAALERFQQAEQAAKAAERPIRAAAFSPDGTKLLTAGDLNIVHLWDATTGAALGSYGGHSGSRVTALAFPDSETLVSAADDQSVRLWEVNPDWRLERTIGAADRADLIRHRVTTVDFRFDSQHLLAGSGVPSRDGELHVFQVADGSRVLHLPNAHDDVVYAARFSPDGDRIASAGADGLVRCFDAVTGAQLQRFEGHTGYVLSVSWKADGQTLASASADGSVRFWDAATGDRKRTVSNFGKHVTGVKFIGDTDDVFCVGGDRSTRMVRSTNGGTIRNFSGAAAWLHATDITPDGRTAVAGDAFGRVYAWDTTNGRLLHTLGRDEQKE